MLMAIGHLRGRRAKYEPLCEPHHAHCGQGLEDVGGEKGGRLEDDAFVARDFEELHKSEWTWAGATLT